MVEQLRHFLFYLHRQSQKRPKLYISLALSVLAVGLVCSSQLQFLLSIDDLIDPDFKTYNDLKTVQNSFHDHANIFLSIESSQMFSKDFLCDIQTWILDTASSNGELLEINSSFGVRQVISSAEKFRVVSALDLDCMHRELPETEKIRAGLQHIEDSPWGDILSSKNNPALTINFLVRDPEDQKYGSFDTKITGELESSLQKEILIKYPNLKAFWGGVGAYQSHLRHAFDQTQVLNIFMFALLLLFFRLFFGSWRLGHLFNLTTLAIFIVTYGLMGALHFPIDALSNSVGLMLILAALEDFVFIAHACQNLGWSLKKSLRVYLVPSFLTSLTTAIGFGSLLTSDLGIVRRFGLASASGAMLEWVGVFLILPALLKTFPQWKLWRFSKTKNRMRLPSLPRLVLPKKVAFVICLFALMPLLMHQKLKVSDSPADFFARDHIANRTLSHLLKERGWINEVSLLFDSELPPEKESDILNKIEKLRHVHRLESTQKAKEFLGENLDRSDRNLIGHLWNASRAAHRLVGIDGTKRAKVFLDTMDMQEVRSILDEVQVLCPQQECRLVGGLISYNEFSLRVLHTLFSSLGMSLLLVGLIIWWSSRHLSLRQRLSCLLSAIWGPLALLGIFVIFDIPLFFVSCICASVLVGLTGDNALQFILRSRKGSLQKSIHDLAPASLILTCMMIGITCLFFFSEMAPLTKLAGIMILGFLLGYVGDVFLLKGLIQNDQRD